jgi:hypothetical protein
MSREQAEANVTHHESLSELPTGALVCVVMVQGPFGLAHIGGAVVWPAVPGGPTPTPVPTKPVTASVLTGFMIFDASTGNLIGYGF